MADWLGLGCSALLWLVMMMKNFRRVILRRIHCVKVVWALTLLPFPKCKHIFHSQLKACPSPRQENPAAMRLETTDSSGRQIGERWNGGEKWEKIERKTLTFPFLSSHHGKKRNRLSPLHGGGARKKGRMLGGFRGKCGKSFPFFLPKHSLPRHISSLQMTNYYSNFPLFVCVCVCGKKGKERKQVS